MERDFRFTTASKIVLPAVIAAILIVVKEALAFIPNVEAVTLIIVVCAYVFPARTTIFASIVFCTGEWLIYGFGYWVVAYYIYYPLLAATALFLKLVKKPIWRAVAATAIAVVLTAFFGVLTSAVDALFIVGFKNVFFKYFAVIYARGIYFYLTHIISSFVTVSVLFTPISLSLKKYLC